MAPPTVPIRLPILPLKLPVITLPTQHFKITQLQQPLRLKMRPILDYKRASILQKQTKHSGLVRSVITRIKTTSSSSRTTTHPSTVPVIGVIRADNLWARHLCALLWKRANPHGKFRDFVGHWDGLSDVEKWVRRCVMW